MSALLKRRLTLIRVPTPPDYEAYEPRMREAAAFVRRLFSGTAAEIPTPDDLEHLAQELSHAHRQHDEDWMLSPRKLRLSPWAVLGPFHEDGATLANDPKFVGWYLQRFERGARPRAFLAMAHAYLYYYHPKMPDMAPFRDVALRGLNEARSLRTSAFLELHEIFGLLDANGYEAVAKAFINSAPQGEAFLDQIGLSGSLADSAFLGFVFRSVTEHIRRDLGRGSLEAIELERRVSLGFRPNSHKSSFRFGPEVMGAFADALLEPFERTDPEGKIRKLIKNLLLDALGDPRLKPVAWNRVGVTAQTVFRRWLVEGTLDDFFRLLDQRARYYQDADRQWRFRSAFWQAYLREGHIVDAWVALGPRLALDSRQYLSPLAGTYAELKSGDGARNDHAALVLRVGGLVIAEWSHSSKVRIWSDRSASAPEFYKKRYLRSDLVTDADFELAHHGAVRGTWQRKLESHIRRRTGIRFGLKELMPDGRAR